MSGANILHERKSAKNRLFPNTRHVFCFMSIFIFQLYFILKFSDNSD